MWIRIRMQRVGWEDIWATIAFICGVLTVASDWVYLANSGENSDFLGVLSKLKRARVRRCRSIVDHRDVGIHVYVYMSRMVRRHLPDSCRVSGAKPRPHRAVRISIIFSIIRIIPAEDRLHVYGLRIIIIYVLTGSAFIVEKAVSCTYAHQAFHVTSETSPFSCYFLRSLSISEMAGKSASSVHATVFNTISKWVASVIRSLLSFRSTCSVE